MSEVLLVRGEDALTEFRATWTGERMLDLLKSSHGRLRVDWVVGVGKSHNIDQVITTAILQDRYDLVIALFPTRRLIDERAWIQAPPNDIFVVNLEPRPRLLCGHAADRLWSRYEVQGLGALGRVQICRPCPLRPECHWPDQLGKGLSGARVIFGTQAHLERSPTFPLQLAQWAGAERVLALLDEANFIMNSQRREIPRREMIRLIDVLRAELRRSDTALTRSWLKTIELLMHANTQDIRSYAWRLPRFGADWAYAVQEEGWQRHGEQFRFIGHDLLLFGLSPLESRERAPDGTLSFSVPPALGCDFIVYSAGTDQALSAFRLGQDFAHPFADFRFEHPGTTWYNLASRLGTHRHFRGNAAQILDAFGALIAQRLSARKRVLCIAKKRYVAFCANKLETRLHQFGFTGACVIVEPNAGVDLSDPLIVPIIGYGAIGTNRFERFDAAYCLTGFYVSNEVLSDLLQNQAASDFHVPLSVGTSGQPPRRFAGALNPQHRLYDVHRLAQSALDYLEMGTVMQAIGRVRPYTRPREIITFQCAAHPTHAYTQEFTSLVQFRRFFGLDDRRTAERNQNRQRIQQAKNSGATQAEVAALLGLSLRTVKRYWRAEEGDTNPIKIIYKDSCHPAEGRS